MNRYEMFSLLAHHTEIPAIENAVLGYNENRKFFKEALRLNIIKTTKKDANANCEVLILIENMEAGESRDQIIFDFGYYYHFQQSKA